MSRWIDASIEDMQQSAYIAAEQNNITEASIEKDWWVTATLKVLFTLSTAHYMYFKGGTSLSKGWGLIDRFSEDIDVALHRDFYYNEMHKECARPNNNNQIKKLRVLNRKYITGDLVDELRKMFVASNLGECEINPVTIDSDGVPIDSDRDPVVIEVHYPSKVTSDPYVQPVVKIEISCLSMKEPFEVRRISSLVGELVPGADDETFADIPTIHPCRTFLEKAFLLSEEYQRTFVRTDRMSRHLYDLERLMGTNFASIALSDMPLYREIVEHRRKFYHIGEVNYDLDFPETISFCPVGEIRERMKLDYDKMKTSMIYGDKLSFEKLISRIEELQERFHSINETNE